MHEVLKSGGIDITERSLRTFLDKDRTSLRFFAVVGIRIVHLQWGWPVHGVARKRPRTAMARSAGP